MGPWNLEMTPTAILLYILYCQADITLHVVCTNAYMTYITLYSVNKILINYTTF